MTRFGCDLSLFYGRKLHSGKYCPGLKRRRGPIRGLEWPNSNISLHKQKNANPVSCVAFLGLVQVQVQRQHLKDVTDVGA